MTTGLAKFYNMRGSLSSGEYPLLDTDMDLSEYLISSATVKYAKGLQTLIRVPTFTSYDVVNIVELDGMYYWVSEWKESTTYSGSVEMVLDFMGPTSLLRRGDAAKGNWHKLPANYSPYLRDSVTNDMMIEKSSVRPTDIEVGTIGQYSVIDPTVTRIGFWYQIIGYDSDGNMKKWGGFMPYSVEHKRFDPEDRIMDTYSSGSGTKAVYPNIWDLIKNINAYTGLQADRILDFSISARCPYKIYRDPHLPYQVALQLYDSLGTTVTRGTNVRNATVSGQSYAFYLYDLTTYPYALQEQTVTLNLTDMQRAIGMVGIKDWNNNTIVSIPNSDTIEVSFQTVGDIAGIYTIIKADNVNMAIPEGKLPYLSNNWMDYLAYQMDTDRMSMENAIKYAQYEKETDLMGGLANTAINAVSTGVMTGAIAGNYAGAITGAASGLAGLGVSIYQSDRAYELAEMKARDSFALSQKQAKLQPQTAYNVGYGTIYCTMNGVSPLRLCLSMPKNIDSDYYEAWLQEFGYPAEGVMEATIEEGYYQGQLITDAIADSGMYWDEMNKTFMKGFKFVNPGEPIDMDAIYYESRIRVNTGWDVLTWYSNIRLRGNPAYFQNTDGQHYANLCIRSTPSQPDIPGVYYMSLSNGSDYGVNEIELIDVSLGHNTSKLTTSGGFTGSTKTFYSQSPADLTELILSGDFELKEETE